jgi:hypothetical protein
VERAVLVLRGDEGEEVEVGGCDLDHLVRVRGGGGGGGGGRGRGRGRGRAQG